MKKILILSLLLVLSLVALAYGQGSYIGPYTTPYWRSVISQDNPVHQPLVADSNTFFQILDADGGTPIFNVDSTNERVGIGTNAPVAELDMGTGHLVLGATEVFSDCKITIKQSSDGDGIAIFGFDDEASNRFELNIDNTGRGRFDTNRGVLFSNSGGQMGFGSAGNDIKFDPGNNMVIDLATDRSFDIRDDDNAMLLTIQENTGFLTLGEDVYIGESLLDLVHATPYITLHNSTHEDTDGGRESIFQAFGEQSGGEETTLGLLTFRHSGAADDEKGEFAIAINATADGDSPTEVLLIDPNIITFNSEKALFQPLVADSTTFFQINDKDGNNILTGDTTNNRIIINKDASGDALMIGGVNKDVDFHMGDSGNWAQYGFYWRYKGTGGGNNNALELWAENQTGTDIQVYNITQDGELQFTATEYFFQNDTGLGSDHSVYRIASGSDTASAGFYLTNDSSNPTTSANSSMGMLVHGDTDSYLHFVGDAVGNAMVFTNIANRTINHDHTTQTNPTIFIHSDTSPDSDNTQWLGLTHDQTDALFTKGSGTFKFSSTTPYITLHNSTHEDTDKGGEVRIIGKREDGAGTETAAGQIEIRHSGAGANNQLGEVAVSINTGAGLAEKILVDPNFTHIGDGTNETLIDPTGTMTQTGTAQIKWTKITAASITQGAGNHSGSTGGGGGLVGDITVAHDGNFYHIDEVAADPGFELTIHFTSVTSFNWVNIFASYDGGSTHPCNICVYNWNTTAWDCFDAFSGHITEVSTADEYTLQNHDFIVPDYTNYVGTGGNVGEVNVKIAHESSGSSNHDFDMDVACLYQ